MVIPLILASGSAIRAQMLRNANVDFDVKVARVDEDMLKQSMIAQNAPPRDIADVLADMKASKVSGKNPDAWVLGCDQVLDFQGHLISKPTSAGQALDQLKQMRGKSHKLFTAAVIYQDRKPVWRHVGQVRLGMRASTDDYLRGYVDQNWQEIRHCAGGYMLESEGVRLFESIDGDFFNVLGMPLLEILNYLAQRGVIAR